MANDPVVSARKGGGALLSPVGRRVRWTKAKRKQFLTHLSRTANVSASVRKAGMGRKAVYLLRGRDPNFAADWLAALTEAYDNLELQLLDQALNGRERVVRTADGERTVVCHDTGMMLRLLAQHRAAVRGGTVATETAESIKRRAAAMRDRLAQDVATIRERLGIEVADEEGAPDDAAAPPHDAAPAAGALTDDTRRDTRPAIGPDAEDSGDGPPAPSSGPCP